MVKVSWAMVRVARVVRMKFDRTVHLLLISRNFAKDSRGSNKKSL